MSAHPGPRPGLAVVTPRRLHGVKEAIARSLLAWILAAVTLGWLLPVAATARPMPAPARTAAPASVGFYRPFLEGRRTLGFRPGPAQYAAVRKLIVTDFIREVQDVELDGALVAEVGRLLEEAGGRAREITSLKRGEGLPQAILKQVAGRVPPDLVWVAMMRGMLGSLHDPHSELILPSEYAYMDGLLKEDSYGGIGAFIEEDEQHDRRLTVVDVVEGGPADKGGLQPGDVLMEVDGRSARGMTMDDAARFIVGKPGTPVRLVVLKDRATAPRQLTLTRAEVRAVSVTARMLTREVGCVRIRSFGEKTATEVRESLRRLQADGMKALVLDVRNNSGGRMDAAQAVCSNFIPSGTLVFSTVGRRGATEEVRACLSPRVSVPMVVLINGGSASASEITAGCLRDAGVATLLGTRSHGKGSMQGYWEMAGGAGVRLTLAHMLTPRGHAFHGVGLDPDVRVEMDRHRVGRPDDVQVQAASAALTQGRLRTEGSR